jgi:hypothetical protein
MKGVCGAVTTSGVRISLISNNHIDKSEAGGDQFIIKGETHYKKSEENQKAR